MKSLLYHGFGIKGYRYRRTRYEKGRSSSSWSRALPDEEADTSWISVAGCAHGGHRAETRGVEGQGTAMVEHDDGGGIRAVPPSRDRNHAPLALRIERIINDELAG
jgi:hypothetical protein